MQPFIIGTAGHIDHGKTTLIKALTGRDTDTLAEEKRRGISIDLGFTYFDLPSGKRAGIVDVPGHEKFIKNAIAGMTGMNLILMVIAADEGIMPQTEEHLAILELLGIKKGIIVLTKADKVEDTWLSFIKEEVILKTKDSFLRAAPVVEVDSLSGRGISGLVSIIDSLTEESEVLKNPRNFRIPIDRIFTVKGFGTVVTGTQISGKINIGDECEIYTGKIKSSIRNIQVHGENVTEAQAGQRVALNLTNIKVDQLKRGDVLASISSMTNTLLIDARLNYLDISPKPLKNRLRVRIYIGTMELIARVVILDKTQINPSESGLVQLQLEKPVAVMYGDRFIIRSYSPMTTLGGGIVLNPNPVKHRALDKNVIEALLVKEEGSDRKLVEQIILEAGDKFLLRDELFTQSDLKMGICDDIVNSLIEDGLVHEVEFMGNSAFIHSSIMKEIELKALNLLKEYHKNNPLKQGISKEEFKVKLTYKAISNKLFDELLELLKKSTIDMKHNFICLKGFEVILSEEEYAISLKLLEAFQPLQENPKPPREIFAPFGKNAFLAERVFKCLLDMGKIIKLNEDVFLAENSVDAAKVEIIAEITENGSISVGKLRDRLSTSRKLSIAILEYCDDIRFTKRIDNSRILYK